MWIFSSTNDYKFCINTKHKYCNRELLNFVLTALRGMDKRERPSRQTPTPFWNSEKKISTSILYEICMNLYADF